MGLIEITGATGTGPYDIIICDVTLTYCYTAATSVSIPPTYYATIPVELMGVGQVVVELVDSSGCSCLQVCDCPIPSVTPTLTPTVTPTMMVNCNCLEFNNPDTLEHTISFINCDGILVETIIPPETILLFCGKSPLSDDPIVKITIGDFCIDGACPPPPPSNTPSLTPTNTSTPTVTPSTSMIPIVG